MSGRPSSLVAAVLVLFLPLVLDACGGGSSDQGEDPTGPDTSNQPPTVSITQPSADTTAGQSYNLTLKGSATDPEDGELSGGALVWESSQDGEIGTGQTITVSGLSVGEHTITLTATDSDGSTADDQVGTTILDLEPVQTVLEDPYLDALVTDFTSSKQSAVESALSNCDAALSNGNVPALQDCLEQARSEATSTSNPNDRAVGASLDLLLAYAERQLTP